MLLLHSHLFASSLCVIHIIARHGEDNIGRIGKESYDVLLACIFLDDTPKSFLFLELNPSRSRKPHVSTVPTATNAFTHLSSLIKFM